MARELFAASFVSCWAELDSQQQAALVRSLEVRRGRACACVEACVLGSGSGGGGGGGARGP